MRMRKKEIRVEGQESVMAVFSLVVCCSLLFGVAVCHPLKEQLSQARMITKAMKVKASGSVGITCPDGGTCLGGTCCAIGSYYYGCCPDPLANCCSDLKHCCPWGKYCTGYGTCTSYESHPLLKLLGYDLNKEKVTVRNVICPDGAHQCPDGDTCCSIGGDNYNFGCCPKPNAECCADMKHCCPEGYSCATNECIKDTSSHPLLEVVGRPKEQKVKDITCPDGAHQCPDGDTCCSVGGGNFGCCPKPSAVCCPDMKHCCPGGFSCTTNKCIKDTSSHPLLELIGRPKKQKVRNVFCPGGNQQCPDGDTCCNVGDDIYGCCPKPSAVCCADMKHCCPEGYSCSTNECIKDTSSHPLLEVVGRPKEQKVKDITCPDGAHQCPDGDTCCSVGGGNFGCCPKPSAVCCPDMKHCCPGGFSCTTNKCIKDTSSHPLLELIGRPKKQKVRNVFCPGGNQQCPDGDTCCNVGDDIYGCCPKPSAVCCADMKHCCPEGYSCSTNECIKDGSSHPLLELIGRPKEQEVHKVSCPGGTCPDGDTCCSVGGGNFGCCPEPNAVCCDKKNCCPEGYRCLTNGCKKDGSSHPLLEIVSRPQKDIL